MNKTQKEGRQEEEDGQVMLMDQSGWNTERIQFPNKLCQTVRNNRASFSRIQ